MSLKSRVTSTSSHNLHHSEERVPLRSDSDQSCLNSSPEFDFCLRQNSKQRFSHADELFSYWKNLSHTATDIISKKTEITSPRSNLQTLAAKSDTRDSDSDDPSFGCGFWLVRSKSVGYSMRNKKTNSSSEYQRSNSDPHKKKKKKSLQKMNSTEIRASRSMNSPALNVPLADIFCLGPVFSGSRDRRK
ncbi:unnamed protein product [Arabidopsis thaliana]|uniref:(thale cress) hypothetical protein n=1 Tax=Arabidopsis thaliana TaxID=3702 RepID=A0A7G2FFZ1_ARATH|nr:unnamed protein product [Arabidopsis thaliana]